MRVHAGVLRVLVCLSRVHVWRARACALSLFLGMLLLLFEDKTEINYAQERVHPYVVRVWEILTIIPRRPLEVPIDAGPSTDGVAICAGWIEFRELYPTILIRHRGSKRRGRYMFLRPGGANIIGANGLAME